MTGCHVCDLGQDILLCADPTGATEQLAGRHRFLDGLWLPCALVDLTKEQIFVINRYRESVIAKESQYEFAARARRALGAVVAAFKPEQVIEIGCGKFPIDASGAKYLGVDIDVEALSTIRQMNLLACHPSALSTTLRTSADLVVSAYAMHFSIDDAMLADLALTSKSDATFCFNLIVDDAVSSVGLLGRLANDWPFAHVVKTPTMARREFFFVVSRVGGANKIDIAARAIRTRFSETSMDR